MLNEQRNEKNAKKNVTFSVDQFESFFDINRNYHERRTSMPVITQASELKSTYSSLLNVGRRIMAVSKGGKGTLRKQNATVNIDNICTDNKDISKGGTDVKHTRTSNYIVQEDVKVKSIIKGERVIQKACVENNNFKVLNSQNRTIIHEETESAERFLHRCKQKEQRENRTKMDVNIYNKGNTSIHDRDGLAHSVMSKMTEHEEQNPMMYKNALHKTQRRLLQQWMNDKIRHSLEDVAEHSDTNDCQEGK